MITAVIAGDLPCNGVSGKPLVGRTVPIGPEPGSRRPLWPVDGRGAKGHWLRQRLAAVGWRRVVASVFSPSSMLQRSASIPGAYIEDANMKDRVERKDDKRWLPLLKWVRRFLRSPWFFRLLFIVWKIYDHFDHE